MKLATFVASQHERFGLVLTDSESGEDWVYDPNIVQQRLLLYASRGTSPYHASPPQFFDAPVPTSLAAFLAQGQAAMAQLQKMDTFLRRFVAQSDPYILTGARFRVADIKLKAPIPRPRFFFGLVQNSPTAWRNSPTRTHLNLFPQGHQRPQGAILDPGDPIVLPAATNIVGGWNPELGVIIGRGGRDIPVEQAMAHVAGLTIVSDVTFDYFRRDMFQQAAPYDWFEDAMSSWGDKKSDARTPVGPYLVTLDEVGNPYDLLIYTRQSGLLRDRSHTGAMALGIERTIHWLSTFRELQPGDLIHMGTMGYDGSPYLSDVPPTKDNFIESEIEKLGVLRNPLLIDSPEQDWRTETDPARRIHPAPVVRDVIARKADVMDTETWSIDTTRHVWLVFGNYDGAEDTEGIKPRPYPRFLCAPATVLADSQQPVHIPETAGDVFLSCELAFVVRQVARAINTAEAADYILGYVPMLAIYDTVFEDTVIEPASMQERYLPQVYGRWRDGSNLVGDLYTGNASQAKHCIVSINDVGRVETNTASTRHHAADVLAYISRYITLFPGDVISLGHSGQRLKLPPGTTYTGSAAIEAVGEISFQIKDFRK